MIDHRTALDTVADPPRHRRVRVSDAERAATVTLLQHALVEGRLDLAETDERVTAAFAARYDSDLQLLVSDLPPQVPVPDEAPAWSAVWVSAVWRARTVVLGADAAAHTRPTPQQCRFAATLACLAVMWMLVCAVVGAAIVT
jgi:hypothetical protein